MNLVAGVAGFVNETGCTGQARREARSACSDQAGRHPPRRAVGRDRDRLGGAVPLVQAQVPKGILRPPASRPVRCGHVHSGRRRRSSSCTVTRVRRRRGRDPAPPRRVPKSTTTARHSRLTPGPTGIRASDTRLAIGSSSSPTARPASSPRAASWSWTPWSLPMAPIWSSSARISRRSSAGDACRRCSNACGPPAAPSSSPRAARPRAAGYGMTGSGARSARAGEPGPCQLRCLTWM